MVNILELIGNDSRRRILELLAKKPCYVSEVSYYLGLAPKVVLEHLEKLEEAGIIKSFEEGKKRYYYIAKRLHLDITISPHLFSVRVVEDARDEIDSMLKDAILKMNSLNLNSSSLSELCRSISAAEKIFSTISAIEYVLTEKINMLMENLLDQIEGVTKDDIERIVLLGLAKGLKNAFEIAESFRVPYKLVQKVLEELEERRIVKRVEDVWVIG